MAARLCSIIFGRASQLAAPALNRAVFAARPCFDFAAVQTAKTVRFGNFQFLGRTLSTLTPGWRNGTTWESSSVTSAGLTDHNGSLLQSSRFLPMFNAQPHRSHIRWSFGKGKRKSVKTVTRRCFRLNWGGWVQTLPGRHKKLWKKWWKRRQRLRRHVLCSRQQNKMFDHMVTDFWKEPKYYVDDPYEPYHVRHGIICKSPRNPY